MPWRFGVDRKLQRRSRAWRVPPPAGRDDADEVGVGVTFPGFGAPGFDAFAFHHEGHEVIHAPDPIASRAEEFVSQAAGFG